MTATLEAPLAEPEPAPTPPEGPFPETLAESLVRALGSLQNVVKSQTATVKHREEAGGGSHTITYAGLGETLAAVRPILARQGLAIMQGVTNEKSQVTVTTTLLHWTGATHDSEPLTLPSGGTPQAVGSAITYARRYQLTALLGLGADDDDGAAAEAHAEKQMRRAVRSQVTKRRRPEPVDTSDMCPADAMAVEFGIPKGKVFVDAINYAKAHELPKPTKPENVSDDVLKALREEYEARKAEADAEDQAWAAAAGGSDGT